MKKRTKIAVLCLGLILVASLLWGGGLVRYVIIGFFGTDCPGTDGPGLVVSNLASDSLKAEVSLRDQSCLEIRDAFALMPTSPSARELRKFKYSGKIFEWTMEVVEVHEFSSGFNVQFKCQNSISPASDIVVSFENNRQNTAMQFKKGLSYKVKGRLREFTDSAYPNAGRIGLSAIAVD